MATAYLYNRILDYFALQCPITFRKENLQVAVGRAHQMRWEGLNVMNKDP
jgi:hypothetical protein